MTESDTSATFEKLTEIDATAPTLIEGLPGHGLVAAIAVDQITKQLSLEHHGNVVSDAFPPVTSFQDGRVRDTVRVHAGTSPAVMTLQSDVALPGRSFDPLVDCVLEDLAAEFEQAIFLAGAPAQRESQVGEVYAVTTSDSLERDVERAGIEMAEGPGLVSGITGALVNACYHADVPATLLVVKANPYLPDPTAAQAVIEEALEPLVEFDIDTTELAEQADEIRQEMEQIAQQYRQVAREGEGEVEEQIEPTMYQ